MSGDLRNLGTYHGEEKLVFCLDIGTTNSAVSISYLVDGQPPDIRVVTSWPGQVEFQGSSKIPTLVRYDNTGKAIQFAEEAAENDQGLDDTHLVQWFKLLLHPESMRADNKISVAPLPPSINLRQVYADFLGFIFNASTAFVSDRVMDEWGGRRGRVWPRLDKNFDVCMAIPNGWSIDQQEWLRTALVDAGVLPGDHDRDRLQFVSESESSVHFAVQHARAGTWLQPGTVFAVCDAGGSTVDSVAYRCIQTVPTIQLEEVTSSECVQAGGALVDMAVLDLLRKRFSATKFGANDRLEAAVRSFERKAKRKFDGGSDEIFVSVGSSWETDRKNRVVKGKATLTSSVVRGAFIPTIAAITTSLSSLLARAGSECQTVILVGGFAESPFLRAELTNQFKSRNIELFKVDEPTKKAAAEGAAFWYTSKHVVARAARATFGTRIAVPFDPDEDEHHDRVDMMHRGPEGALWISGGFKPLILKSEVVGNDTSHKSSFCKRESIRPTDLGDFEVTIFATDAATPPTWCTDTDGRLLPSFREVCTVRADLSGLMRGLEPTHVLCLPQLLGPESLPLLSTFWEVSFEIEIFFGQTTLCAGITWEEDGQVRKSAAALIPSSLA